MTAIAALLATTLGKALAAAGAVLAMFAAVWAAAKRSARKEAEVRDLKSTIQAHEARNEADDAAAADPDPRERMRERWRRQD